MNEVISAWLRKRSKRDLIILLVIGWVVIYFIWYVVLQHGLVKQKKEMEHNLNLLQEQRNIAHEKIEIILNATERNPAYQDWVKRKGSQNTVITQTLSGKDVVGVVKAFLAKQPGITLINLKKLSDELGTSKELAIRMGKQIQKQGFQMQFQANYFDTLNYLERMETLPWHVYFSRVEYNVTTYPDANVTAVFYLLSDKTD